ncbi:Uncharacterised protein [Mycobacteroides abscessus subsp. abscessus]|nr:Uncharacterised protein [Mycobacteroides abscessus subsp. abscessus]SIF26853.1 Uncharacterised protein [Mycobacteroides abscessus subsp. abscessus]
MPAAELWISTRNLFGPVITLAQYVVAGRALVHELAPLPV